MEQGPTPHSGGPAFEMIVVGKAACLGGVGNCLRVKATNLGDRGDGRCRLRGFQTDPNTGADETTYGNWIDLSDMNTNEDVVRVTP